MKDPEKTFDIQDRLDYLYALDGKGIKPGLKRISAFLEKIGNPQKQLKAIHVAGTNGKGSTCAMIASVLQSAGYRVGLYTSPHLVRFNERIRINNRKISNREIVDFLDGKQAAIEELDTTFFETTTALAFDYFVKNNVDIAVLETGLGGRFDATNVITPVLSVITPIGKDHEEFLGHTLDRISHEKAGIIKPGIPVISAQQHPIVRKILETAARNNQSTFHYVPELCRIIPVSSSYNHQTVSVSGCGYWKERMELPLLGAHQYQNLGTALTVLTHLDSYSLDAESVSAGVASTHWHGRLELLSSAPWVYYDVGHNEHGIRRVTRTLRKIFPGQKISVLIALGRRKKVGALGKILRPVINTLTISEIPGNKSYPAAELADALRTDLSDTEIRIEPDFEKALALCGQSLEKDDRLLILGSHYFASAVYNFFKIIV